MLVSPVRASRSMSSIFVANGIVAFSFWSPSRGPTSTIRTWLLNEGGRASVAVANPRRERSCVRRRDRRNSGVSATIFESVHPTSRFRELFEAVDVFRHERSEGGLSHTIGIGKTASRAILNPNPVQLSDPFLVLCSLDVTRCICRAKVWVVN